LLGIWGWLFRGDNRHVEEDAGWFVLLSHLWLGLSIPPIFPTLYN
jgi:hypothetical protein